MNNHIPKGNTFFIVAGFVLVITLFFATLPFCSATIQSLGTFKINTPISLVQSCVTSTSSNITRIVFPDGTINDTLLSMTRNGNDYNYTYSLANQYGQYLVYGVCDETGAPTLWQYNFQVTATGQNLDTSKAITYIIIWIVTFLIFIGLLLIGIYLPSRNESSEMTGYIIAVSNLKYVKVFSLAFAYLVALFIAYFSYSVSYAYLDMAFLTNTLQILFYGLAIFTPIGFVLLAYFTIANLVRDSKISDMLSRGLTVRGGK